MWGRALGFSSTTIRVLSLRPELVAEVGDPLDLLLVDQLGDVRQQARLVDLVGELADDDLLAAVARLLELDLGAHHDAAVPGGVHLGDVAGVDHAPGREVGPRDDPDQVLGADLRIVDEPGQRLAHLTEVVGRDVGGHADRDPAGAVDQQVGEQRGEHAGLDDGRVGKVGLDHVDRVLVDVLDHAHGDRGHPGLGVALCRRGVAVHRAEIALTGDQRVAHHPGLDQARQGVVDRLIAMGVVVLHHLPDDRGRLLGLGAGGDALLEHRVEDPALHRLQAVAHIGQGPADDHAHRVVQVALPHLLLEVDGPDVAGMEDAHDRSCTRGCDGAPASADSDDRAARAPAILPLTFWRAATAAARTAFPIASTSLRPWAMTTSPATPSRRAPPALR